MSTGSNKNVVGLDAVISLFSSSCPIVVKHCSFSFGAMNEAKVLDAVESTFVIVFLMLSILSIDCKKKMDDASPLPSTIEK